MNMRSLIRLLTAAAPVGWLLSSVSLAGSAVTSPPSTPPTLAPAAENSGLGVEASLGWDSHYIFRGELLQKNTAWTQISLDIPLTDSLSLNISPWFLQDIDNDYNEFDLNSALTYSLESWEFSAGYAGYFYPRKSWGDNIGIGDEQEMTASVSRSLGDFNASLMSAYSFTRESFYYQFSLDYELSVSEKLTLTPGVALGWDSDYFDDGTDLNHVALRLAATYQLTSSCSVSPYIAGNLPMGHLDASSNEDIYGGVSLTVGF